MELEFGFSETEITPHTPIQTIGFGVQEPATGVERALMAQAAVWRLGETICAVIAIDHIGFAIDHARSLRTRIADLIGAGLEQVMLCFSHTHAAPNDSAEPEYSEWVDERVLDAVRRAMNGMLPVRAAWGCADVEIGVNRRMGAALDRRAGILKVVDAKTGANAFALLRLTAHGNALKADNRLISPDWIGAARDWISKKLHCPVMIAQGASGNVAPKYFCSKLNPPDADDTSGRFVRTNDALSEMARAVWKGVGRVFDGIQAREVRTLRMHSARKALLARVPEMPRAREIAEEAHRAAEIDGARWLREVARLNAEGVKEQYETVEMQFFQLDEGALIGVANEIMCELALEVAKKAGKTVFLGGYTNGSAGYLPTAEEYDRGGYEVFWSMLEYFMYYPRVMPLERDSAETIVEMALEGIR
ncbi:MAG: alkaline ceramidase [Clostridia bacterium]|nr:alkaline ceramidase [Clostridia bacterium]